MGDGIALRRAVVTAMAQDKNEIEMVLEKSLKQFGDQLYIKHVPSMQQEGEFHVTLSSLSLLTFHSTRPGSLAICWSGSQNFSTSLQDDYTIWWTPERRIKQAWGVIVSC